VGWPDEYVNDALPNHRSSVRLFDRNGLGKRGRTAVLGFDCALQFWCRIFNHWNRHVAAASFASQD
jgi:hypothetical protein